MSSSKEQIEARDFKSDDTPSEVGIEQTIAGGDVSVNDTTDEETRLGLLAFSRDQDDLERDIGRQADQLLTEQADERDAKRLEKTITHKDRLEAQVKKIDERLGAFGNSATKNALRREKAHLEVQISGLTKELEQIQIRIAERHQNQDGEPEVDAADGRLPNETRREFLIRTGKITPFSKVAQAPLASDNLADVMFAAEEEELDDEGEDVITEAGPISHQNLLRPGFNDGDTTDSTLSNLTPSSKSKKRKRTAKARFVSEDISLNGSASDEEFAPSEDNLSGIDDEEHEEESDFDPEHHAAHRKPKTKRRRYAEEDEDVENNNLEGIDDGNERVYRARLQSWSRRRRQAREKAQGATTRDAEDSNSDEENEECYKPHPTRPDADLGEGIRIPGDIYPSLFDYQKTGARWLYELYNQQVGGIVGDEMGLGKTIQAITFIAALHYSRRLTKPVIVVCPATVMRQWVNEFHTWWPPLRVSILHTSGSGMMNVRHEAQLEDDLEIESYDQARGKGKSHKAAQKIVDRVSRDGHVLVTTYSGLQTYSNLLLSRDWQYAVLDEGHKIRNPNAGITMYCKELRTPNRIILSGTPMQNNLTELWSLFDFVYPMRLGTLVTFRTQFEYPIKQGGYANASNLQVETAMQCAETLKDAISPYLLQRFKVDVAADLPKKTERVLFCKLTKLQRREYLDFLDSDEMKSIAAGKRQPLYGIDILRKLCNHPDLVNHKRLSKLTEYNYGDDLKSGKMQVVKALLELWKKGGHKTLLFAQHRIMLDILEKFIRRLPGFRYRRMDGNTSIKDRQSLVDEFNKNPDLHVFLLTTKVGGLGVNLTGADRVIIYDPDWNPSTDVQARERAWRLGQKKEVEIYRLMTAGTIEEKIYHRQIFKQFLTNKILRDPKQRQTFQLRDLHDLFTLADANDSTETGSLFKGTEIKLKAKDNAGIGQDGPSVSNGLLNKAESVSNIAPVVREEEFKGVDEEESATTTKEKSDRILSAIFSRSDIQSAHEHDAILNSNGTTTIRGLDREYIAQEARRTAMKAARELERANAIARATPAGVPTWTGTFGTGGHPDDLPERTVPSLRGGINSRGRGRGRGGPSSSSVLANLAARQAGTGGSSTGTSRASTPQPFMPRGKEFMAMIQDYIKVQGGGCYTQNLIDHFNRYCGTPQRTAEFKEMLRRIATLEKGSRGRGKWVLKDEFK